MDWNDASDVATTLGLAVAGVSAGLALITYRTQVETQADIHMHGLFNGFLSAQLHKPDPAAFETLKLYVLEEMIDWVREQERALIWWGWLRPFSIYRRLKELKQWEATVRGNLGDAKKVYDRINREQSRRSYGKAFHEFVDQERKAAERATAAV